MKIIRLLVFSLLLFCCSTVLGQGVDVFVKLKHALPNILKVTNVRVYSDSPTSAKISVWIDVKDGKVVSISRGGGDWIITLRTRGKVSTYVVSEKSFKVVGEESKAVTIRALHFTESS
jgi:predicted small secreted protein